MVLKRIGLYLLVLCLVFPVLAVTASADEIGSDEWLNVLEYSTNNDSGSNYMAFAGTGEFTYTLPGGMKFSYVDILVDVTGRSLVSASLSDAKALTVASSSLTVTLITSISNQRLYRIYGAISRATYYQPKLTLVSDSTSGYCWAEIVSFKVGGISVSAVPDVCSFNVADWNGNNTATMSAPNTLTSVYWDASEDGVAIPPFRAFVYLTNWKKYDYMDIHMYASVGAVEGVSVYMGQSAVPFEISYLDSEAGTNTEVGQNTGRHILMRIDLTGLDRTSANQPVISVDGWYYGDLGGMFSVYFCTGYVKTSLSGFGLYWHSFKSFMTDLFDPDDSGSEEFKGEAAEKAEQMQQVNSGMNDLQKPDVNGIDVNLDNIVAPNTVVTLTSPLTVLFGNEFFASILFIVVMLALVSYVFFGKK